MFFYILNKSLEKLYFKTARHRPCHRAGIYTQGMTFPQDIILPLDKAFPLDITLPQDIKIPGKGRALSGNLPQASDQPAPRLPKPHTVPNRCAASHSACLSMENPLPFTSLTLVITMKLLGSMPWTSFSSLNSSLLEITLKITWVLSWR